MTDHRPDHEVDWDAQGERYARTRRRVTDTGAYRDLVVDAFRSAPAGPVLDVGAGTGIWSADIGHWARRPVVALEPAAGMRRHAPAAPTAVVHHVAAAVPGLPLRTGAGGGAWLSAVLHHVGDLGACARDLRRVLAPGAPVLIREVFAGRAGGPPQVRFFPEVRRRIAERYPSVDATEAAFAAAGFRRRRIEVVEEHTVDLAGWRRHLPDQRASDTTFAALTDDEFAAGLARVDAAIAAGDAACGAALDLLVLA